jgi:hypothetical protein
VGKKLHSILKGQNEGKTKTRRKLCFYSRHDQDGQATATFNCEVGLSMWQGAHDETSAAAGTDTAALDHCSSVPVMGMCPRQPDWATWSASIYKRGDWNRYRGSGVGTTAASGFEHATALVKSKLNKLCPIRLLWAHTQLYMLNDAAQVSTLLKKHVDQRNPNDWELTWYGRPLP